MQIRLRVMPLGKPSVSELKTTSILGLTFLSTTRQISTVVVTWTNSICAFVLRLSFTHLVWRKLLLSARCIVMALRDHTGSRMLMDVRKLNTDKYTEHMRRKFIPALRWNQDRNGREHCDLWSRWNTALFQCFTRILILLLPWRQAHIPS